MLQKMTYVWHIIQKVNSLYNEGVREIRRIPQGVTTFELHAGLIRDYGTCKKHGQKKMDCGLPAW
jgi:hypothetical protein